MTTHRKLFFSALISVPLCLSGCGSSMHTPNKPVMHRHISNSGVAPTVIAKGYLLGNLKKHGVQIVKHGEKVRVIIPSDELFIFNSSSLKHNSYVVMNNVMRFIAGYGRVPITVNGYTDHVRTVEKNQQLSSDQAKSVVTYLWSHGIPLHYLRPIGHGSRDPIATNENQYGSYYNRRIELTFSVGGSGKRRVSHAGLFGR